MGLFYWHSFKKLCTECNFIIPYSISVDWINVQDEKWCAFHRHAELNGAELWARGNIYMQPDGAIDGEWNIFECLLYRFPYFMEI